MISSQNLACLRKSFMLCLRFAFIFLVSVPPVVIEFTPNMRLSVKKFQRDKFSDRAICRTNKFSGKSLSESFSRRKCLHLKIGVAVVLNFMAFEYEKLISRKRLKNTRSIPPKDLLIYPK